MGALAALCVALAVALACSTSASPSEPSRYDKTFGRIVEQLHRLLDAQPHDVRTKLPVYVFDKKTKHYPRTAADDDTKLERMLRNIVLTFRDKLSKPNPELGLPAFDPLEFDGEREIVLSNAFANVKATLKSVRSTGVSKFKVDKLNLYLVERLGVLDLTLPNFLFELALDIPVGSWVTPMKIPLDDYLKVSFNSTNTKVNYRGEISVKTGRLAMQSTNLHFDLGDYSLALEPLRFGTLSRNPGLADVIAEMVRALAPTLIDNWKPVLEKFLTERLDQKLQELQLSDLINPEH